MTSTLGLSRSVMKTLVAGWFSFPEGHATAGDLLACDLTCEWLREAGALYSVAYAAPFAGGVRWEDENPAEYSHVVFVCGPFEARSELEIRFTKHFAGRVFVGVNLSMLLPLSTWNPFTHLFERDSDRCVRPDVVFLTSAPKVPVVGVCLVEAGNGILTDAAQALITQLVEARPMAVVSIDTRLDGQNLSSLRSPSEIESLIARMDVLITTRLHGMVFALKNGVPVVAIDAEPAVAKVTKQAAAIRWPLVFAIDQVTTTQLLDAFDFCMTPEARHRAASSRQLAMSQLEHLRREVVAALRTNSAAERPSNQL